MHNLLHYFIDGAEQTEWPVIAWVFPCVFLPEASFGLRVLSLSASVCVSVRPSMCAVITCLSAR